jgi:glutathione S-transferase
MQPVLFYGVPQGSSFGSIVALEWLEQPYQLCRIEMLQQPWDSTMISILCFSLLHSYQRTDN